MDMKINRVSYILKLILPVSYSLIISATSHPSGVSGWTASAFDIRTNLPTLPWTDPNLNSLKE